MSIYNVSTFTAHVHCNSQTFQKKKGTPDCVLCKDRHMGKSTLFMMCRFIMYT